MSQVILKSHNLKAATTATATPASISTTRTPALSLKKL
jgi:hypothetical protein